MREHVTPANVISSGNVAAGFVAALVILADHLLLGAVLVVIAGVLDSVDGPVARRGARDGAFGTNLDSLADLVSFGVAPALAVYRGPFHSFPVLGGVLALVFVLCGTWRLARFPLIKNSRRFTGLPIPPTGVALTLLAAWGPPVAVAAGATAAVSVLMVSSVPFPTISTVLGGASSASRHLTHGRFPHR